MGMRLTMAYSIDWAAGWMYGSWFPRIQMHVISLTEPRQPGVSNTGETTTVFVSRHVPSPHT